MTGSAAEPTGMAPGTPVDAAPHADAPEISHEELKRRLHDPSLTIVDVLPAPSYAAEHIPGAINLPLADITSRASMLLPNRGAEIAVYCGSNTCPLAGYAAGVLRELGYTNLRHYHGGIAGWRESGGKVQSSPASDAIADPELVAISPLPRDADWTDLIATGHRPAALGDRRSWTIDLLDLIERCSTTQLFSAWLGMIVLSGLVFWLASAVGDPWLKENGSPVDGGLSGLATAIYFSFVTTSSVGYGDVLPLGPGRIIAVLEAVIGLLIFGAVVSKFVSRRQDELVREIHRTTFEDRLDRVRTNLHLALSEFQTIAAMCDDGAVPPERVGARLESAALVFTGELRTVHDLLYEPQRAPEERILAAILAMLSSSLQALRDLMVRLPHDFKRSPTLNAALKRTSSLAQEVCAECVPQVYAPALTSWMERIKETAQTIG